MTLDLRRATLRKMHYLDTHFAGLSTRVGA